jgi:hypothetical protein
MQAKAFTITQNKGLLNKIISEAVLFKSTLGHRGNLLCNIKNHSKTHFIEKDLLF